MRALLSYFALYKQYKWILILGIILSIITLLANIGLLTLSSWLLSMSSLIGVIGIHSFNYLLPTVGIRAMSIIRTIGRYFERLTNHNFTFHILQGLRVSMFSKLFPLYPSGFYLFRQGELLNHLVADINTLDNLHLRVIAPLISTLIVFIIVILGLSILSFIVTVTISGIIIFVLLMLPILFYYSSRVIGANLIFLRSSYRQKLIDWLQSQTELAIFNANHSYRAQIENIELKWYAAQQRQSEFIAFYQALIMLITGLTTLIILWISDSTIDNNQHCNNALVALLVFCSIATFESLVHIANIFQYLGQVIAAILRINKIITQEPKIKFTAEYSTVPSHIMLCFDHVTFAYGENIQNTLKDVSFIIDAGMRVVILGRTGCGKSTLLQLITRAWDPQRGCISINNILLNKFSEETLRAMISVVPQRVHLFNATLRDNLLLSTSSYTRDKDLCTVLELVGLHKLLEKTHNLNSWLGEGGRQLSGGELKRLAIARALLHDAPLILLDEPTEGLDNTAAIQIFKLLTKEIHDKTMLIVAHHAYGLESFDKVIVMDDGYIINNVSR